jgi:hypothetical protein
MADQFCPACKNLNGAEAVFCIYCGASLAHAAGDTTTPERMGTDLDFLSQVIEKAHLDSLAIPERGVALYLSDSSKAICVVDEVDFILGRTLGVPGKDKVVDLTPYDAYESGVSKRHARLYKTPDGYQIMDLGSTNGTWLNRQKLIPNRAYFLFSGACIYLGRLCLYMTYQKVEAKA